MMQKDKKKLTLFLLGFLLLFFQDCKVKLKCNKVNEATVVQCLENGVGCAVQVLTEQGLQAIEYNSPVTVIQLCTNNNNKNYSNADISITAN